MEGLPAELLRQILSLAGNLASLRLVSTRIESCASVLMLERRATVLARRLASRRLALAASLQRAADQHLALAPLLASLAETEALENEVASFSARLAAKLASQSALARAAVNEPALRPSLALASDLHPEFLAVAALSAAVTKAEATEKNQQQQQQEHGRDRMMVPGYGGPHGQGGRGRREDPRRDPRGFDPLGEPDNDHVSLMLTYLFVCRLTDFFFLFLFDSFVLLAMSMSMMRIMMILFAILVFLLRDFREEVRIRIGSATGLE